MLHAHPRIAIPPEVRFTLPLYDRRIAIGDLADADNRRVLARRMTRGRQFADLGLPRRRTRKRIVAAEPTLGSAYAAIFRAYADRFDAPRWGDKRPAYIRRLDVIRRLYPDAQIVHIIRDGRDCVASLQRMPWWGGGFTGAVALWTEAMRAGAVARRRQPPRGYHELYYEDLVRDPRPVLEDLCTFLGERFDEAMLSPHRTAEEAVPAHKVWHSRLHAGVDPAAIARWQRDLTAAQLAVFERAAGRWMVEHNYRAVTDARPPADLWRSYLAHATKRRIVLGGLAAMDLVRRAREPNPVAYVPDGARSSAARANGEG
jgi:hypothetical protein